MSIIIFILLLVGLIIVHECGHFFAAKLFGIRVDEFGIGFPPRLLGWRFGETLYSLNWLPFGGFVRIFGERGEEESDRRSFASRSRWVQAAVVFAGVLFNFLFAWLALSAGFMVGLPTVLDGTQSGAVRDVRATVLDVAPASPAEAAGFRYGDIVRSVSSEGETLAQGASAAEARAFIAEHGEAPVAITVLRGQEETTFTAVPKEGVVEGRRALGIVLEDIGIVSHPPLEALRQAGALSLLIIQDTARGLWNFGSTLFTARADFSNVAGPVGIAQVGGSAVQEGYAAIILLLAIISVNLGLINLLPIPGLDGGRLVFIAVEAMKGSPVSDRLTVGLTVVGFALLAALMLIVTYHDLVRILG